MENRCKIGTDHDLEKGDGKARWDLPHGINTYDNAPIHWILGGSSITFQNRTCITISFTVKHSIARLGGPTPSSASWLLIVALCNFFLEFRYTWRSSNTALWTGVALWVLKKSLTPWMNLLVGSFSRWLLLSFFSKLKYDWWSRRVGWPQDWCVVAVSTFQGTHGVVDVMYYWYREYGLNFTASQTQRAWKRLCKIGSWSEWSDRKHLHVTNRFPSTIRRVTTHTKVQIPGNQPPIFRKVSRPARTGEPFHRESSNSWLINWPLGKSIKQNTDVMHPSSLFEECFHFLREDFLGDDIWQKLAKKKRWVTKFTRPLRPISRYLHLG